MFEGILDGVDLEHDHIKGKPCPDMFLESLRRTCENAKVDPIDPKVDTWI